MRYHLTNDDLKIFYKKNNIYERFITHVLNDTNGNTTHYIVRANFQVENHSASAPAKYSIDFFYIKKIFMLNMN